MKSNFVVISDFDGTITKRDTNDIIIDTFGSKENVRIENKFKNSEIGTKESLESHYQHIKLTEQEYKKTIQENTELQDGFIDFVHNCSKQDTPLWIVSGGFENIIRALIKGTIADHYAELYANKLIFEGDDIKAVFRNDSQNCQKHFGPCGNCKLKHLYDLRTEEGKSVVFIGDGLTDRCAAEAADIVFAKARLAEFCHDQGIPFIQYSDFFDINNYLFGEHTE